MIDVFISDISSLSYEVNNLSDAIIDKREKGVKVSDNEINLIKAKRNLLSEKRKILDLILQKIDLVQQKIEDEFNEFENLKRKIGL